MHLEDIAVLHYNKHDSVIHACVLYAFVSSNIKVNVLAPSSVYSLLPPRVYPRILSCICVFDLGTSMHV